MNHLRLAPCFLLVSVILASGCSTQPSPTFTPTTFFNWCVKEHFGTKSPTNTFVFNTSGATGFVNGMIWIPSKTEQEAQVYLKKTFAAIREKAGEQGCEIFGTNESPASLNADTLKYRSGPNKGTLEAKYELRDTPEAGRIVKAYWITFHLTEELDSK
jgi:hypothetical protein